MMFSIPSIWCHKAALVNVDSYLQIKYLIQLCMLVCGVTTSGHSLSHSLQFCVLGYRVTGAMLVCGVHQSPRGSQLHVMVSISLVHNWEGVRVCICVGVGERVLFRVEVHTGQELPVILNHDDSVVLL